jgi:hypothetical protein
MMYITIAIALMCAPLLALLLIGVLKAKRLAETLYQLDLIPLTQCVTYLEQRSGAAADGKSIEEREAMEIYVADRFRSITNDAFWTNKVVQKMISPPQRHLAEQAVASHPAPGKEAVAKATAILEPVIKSLRDGPKGGEAKALENKPQRKGGKLSDPDVEEFILAFFMGGFPSLVASLLFRRGLGPRLLKVEIVTKNGLPAPHWRTFLRWLYAWLPISLTYIVAYQLDSVWPFWIFGCAVVGGIIYRRVRPGRPIRERLSGTWLVPE